MIVMPRLETVLRSGAVVVEVDRENSVLLLCCEQHRVQDAISLYGRSLAQQAQDFFARHRSCDSRHDTPADAKVDR